MFMNGYDNYMMCTIQLECHRGTDGTIPHEIGNSFLCYFVTAFGTHNKKRFRWLMTLASVSSLPYVVTVLRNQIKNQTD